MHELIDGDDREGGPAPRVPGLGLLTAALAAWYAALLAGWLPHYLTWPWYVDHDHFAMLAQLWDRAGKVPYRDSFSMQFPGETYLYYAVLKPAGWGNTVAFNAADAGMVVAAGLAFVAWGLGRFGRLLPGLVGATWLLAFYADKDFTYAGQRDWHAAFYATVGLVSLLAWRGRGGRFVSAVGFGLALLTRPQFVLLGPAMLLGVDAQVREPGEPFGRSVRPALAWGLVAGLTLGLGFLPLLVTGALDDFFRCLRTITYGSATGYNRVTAASFLSRVSSQLGDRAGDSAVPLAVVLLDARGRRGREGLVLLAALTGLFFYMPISPNSFSHYQFPFQLALCAASVYLAGLLIEARPRPAVLLTSLLLLLSLGALRRPEFWTVRGNFENRLFESKAGAFAVHRKTYGVAEAVSALRSGGLPRGNPPGYREFFRPEPWGEVRDTLEYLRGHTGRGTTVANLALDCPGALNGTAARLSPLPADNWSLIQFPGVNLEPNVAALRAAVPDVVVWSPGFDESVYPQFGALWQAVRQNYRREAAFGATEVWRRASPGPDSGAAGGG